MIAVMLLCSACSSQNAPPGSRPRRLRIFNACPQEFPIIKGELEDEGFPCQEQGGGESICTTLTWQCRMFSNSSVIDLDCESTSYVCNITTNSTWSSCSGTCAERTYEEKPQSLIMQLVTGLASLLLLIGIAYCSWKCWCAPQEIHYKGDETVRMTITDGRY